MGSNEVSPALVGRIYGTVLDPGNWFEVFEAISRRVGADGWHALAWDAESEVDLLGLASPNFINSGVIRAYTDHYGRIDPRRQLADVTPVGNIVSCRRHFDERFVARSEFFQDFVLPARMRYSIGLCLHRGANITYQVGFTRQLGAPAFGAGEETLLATLSPHLVQSIHIAERLRLACLETTASAAALATQGIGALVVGASGTIGFANGVAEAMLHSEEVLRQRDGRAALVDVGDQSAFSAALAKCVQCRTAQSVLAGAGMQSCALVLLPLEQDLTPFGPCRAAMNSVLCLVAPHAGRRRATLRQLMALFRLTPAEARLARALAASESLQNYAVENHLKLPTVKSQLQRIFEKTRTQRQVELVQLIRSIPAVREGSSGIAAKRR